jgi:hypothetical protein
MPTNCPKGKTASFTTGGHFQDPAAFHYSKAIAGSGTVGNEQTLDPFLAAPRKMFPGTSTHVADSPLSAANRGVVDQHRGPDSSGCETITKGMSSDQCIRFPLPVVGFKVCVKKVPFHRASRVIRSNDAVRRQYDRDKSD